MPSLAYLVGSSRPLTSALHNRLRSLCSNYPELYRELGENGYDEWYNRFAAMKSGEADSEMLIKASVIVSEAENDAAWYMRRRKMLLTELCESLATTESLDPAMILRWSSIIMFRPRLRLLRAGFAELGRRSVLRNVYAMLQAGGVFLVIYTIAVVVLFFFSSAFFDSPSVADWIDEAARLGAVSGVAFSAFRKALSIPQVEYFRDQFRLWDWRYRAAGFLALASIPAISLYATVGPRPHIYLPGAELPVPLAWAVTVITWVVVGVVCLILVQVTWKALLDFFGLVWRFLRHPTIVISRRRANASANILFTGLYLSGLFFGLAFLCLIMAAPLAWLEDSEVDWVAKSGTFLADLLAQSSVALIYLTMFTPMLLALLSLVVRFFERRRRRQIARNVGLRREPTSAWMVGAAWGALAYSLMGVGALAGLLGPGASGASTMKGVAYTAAIMCLCGMGYLHFRWQQRRISQWRLDLARASVQQPAVNEDNWQEGSSR